jgi:hypothetical protein
VTSAVPELPGEAAVGRLGSLPVAGGCQLRSELADRPQTLMPAGRRAPRRLGPTRWTSSTRAGRSGLAVHGIRALHAHAGSDGGLPPGVSRPPNGAQELRDGARADGAPPMACRDGASGRPGAWSLVRGLARSAAAPLNRKCRKPRCPVGANVSNSDVFPQAPLSCRRASRLADGRRGRHTTQGVRHADAL